jgi:SAM-dependent methyltransferase
MTAALAYPGGELEIFAGAANWKRYWAGHVLPYLGGRVLEVGAGIGANITALDGACDEWICLEPDRNLARRIAERIAREGRHRWRVLVGTIADVSKFTRFDAILYIDVLEHIEDDRGELAAAARHLEEGGHLVVLSPACPWLFSPFDAAIGHHRRYTSACLEALAPEGVRLVALKRLDSVGMLASAANRYIFRTAAPRSGQVMFWDQAIVPLSRILDPLFAYRLGKSVLAVWRREPGGPSAASGEDA